MEYRLLIIRKDGAISKHYFSTYETLDYNAQLVTIGGNN